VTGYIDIFDPKHPLARADGYVSEHRRMAWDAGLLTDPAHQVHHVNGNKKDNRLDNFAVMTVDEHALFHAEDRGFVRNQFGVFAVKPRAKRMSAPRPIRPCVFCGEQIPLSRRRDAIYCSERCRGALRRARACEDVA
jgi:hypothetical protein